MVGWSGAADEEGGGEVVVEAARLVVVHLLVGMNLGRDGAVVVGRYGEEARGKVERAERSWRGGGMVCTQFGVLCSGGNFVHRLKLQVHIEKILGRNNGSGYNNYKLCLIRLLDKQPPQHPYSFLFPYALLVCVEYHI